MEFNKKNTRTIMFLILFGVIVFWGFQNMGTIFNAIGYLYKILFPLILGLCMAFVINIPMSVIEDKLFENNKKIKQKTKRIISFTLATIFIIAIIILVIGVVIPELISVISKISGQIPGIINNSQEWIMKIINNYPDLANQAQNIGIDLNNISSNLIQMLQNFGGNLVSSSVNLLLGIVGGIINTFIGFLFAMYILLEREQILNRIKKIMYAYIKEEKVEKIANVTRISDNQFNKFITGQFIDAIIIGFISFICMIFVLGISSAISVGVLMFAICLIPVIGIYIGIVIGACLIAITSPVKAIIFVIVMLILSQIDANFINPKVLGKNIGLPAIWVLASITIGSAAFGLIGFIISIPICSILYILLMKNMNLKLENEKI